METIVDDLPSGILTFLFTGIEESTRLWEQYPEQMKKSLQQMIRFFEMRSGGIMALSSKQQVMLTRQSLPAR